MLRDGNTGVFLQRIQGVFDPICGADDAWTISALLQKSLVWGSSRSDSLTLAWPFKGNYIADSATRNDESSARQIWSAAAESRLCGTATPLWISFTLDCSEKSKALSPLRSASALQNYRCRPLRALVSQLYSYPFKAGSMRWLKFPSRQRR